MIRPWIQQTALTSTGSFHTARILTGPRDTVTNSPPVYPWRMERMSLAVNLAKPNYPGDAWEYARFLVKQTI